MLTCSPRRYGGVDRIIETLLYDTVQMIPQWNIRTFMKEDL